MSNNNNNGNYAAVAAADDDGEAGVDRPLLHNHDGDADDDGETGGGHARSQTRTSRVQSALSRALRPLAEPEKLGPTEKLLLGAALLLLLLAAVFIGLFAGAQNRLNHRHGRDDSPSAPSVCNTRDCVLASASVLQSIDTTVNPCDDFYSFATGGWTANPAHQIPDDAGEFGTFALVAQHNAQIVRDVLARAPTQQKAQELIAIASSDDEKVDVRNLAKLKTFYATCMDTREQNKVGDKPLREVIHKLQELLNSKDEDGMEWDTADGRVGPDGEWDDIAKGEWGHSYFEQSPEATSEDQSYFEHAMPPPPPPSASSAAASSTTGPPPAPPGSPPPLPPNRAPGRAPLPHPPSTPPSPPPSRSPRQRSLTRVLSWAHSRGIPAFWEIAVDGDPIKDPTRGTVYIGPSGLGFPDKSYYEDDEQMRFYEGVVEDGLRAAGSEQDSSSSSSSSSPRRLARQVVDLERRLAELTPDGDVLADPVATYNPVDVNKLGYTLDAISWPDYLSALTVRVPARVVVQSPHFFKGLSTLLSRTRDDVLEAYLTWTAIRDLARNLGPNVALRRPAESLARHISGVALDAKEDRSKVCLAELNQALGFMAGRYFVKEAFPPSAREKAAFIIRSIVASFKDRLPQLTWLDAETRQAAQVKADHVRVKVGYPDSPNTTDASAIERYFSSYDVKENDHFGNQLRGNTWSVQRDLARADRTLDPLRWEMFPAEVNAYYNPGANEIVFPAGILQEPYFNEAWPDYMQYGAFGAVSGHELSHAFDPTGRLYDEDGFLRDWWSKQTAREFQARQHCLMDQYGNRTLDDGTGRKLPLNPKLTIGEDVADAGGVAQSFQSWQNVARDSAERNQLLPGLAHLTREQLFFISYGVTWARNARPEQVLRRIRTDPHSPNPWRVNGVLTNFEPFYEAFGCKAGDRMFTPKEERCQIW